MENKNKINNLISQDKQLTRDHEIEKSKIVNKNNELLNDINSLKCKYEKLQSNSPIQINDLKRKQEEEKNQIIEKNRELEN